MVDDFLQKPALHLPALVVHIVHCLLQEQRLLDELARQLGNVIGGECCLAGCRLTPAWLSLSTDSLTYVSTYLRIYLHGYIRAYVHGYLLI